MLRRRAGILVVAAIGLLLGTAAVTVCADPLSAGERSGQRLYQLGLTDGAALSARLAQGTVRLNGAPAACARCHGSDGDGGSESGVLTPALNWGALTRARAAGAGLRERPAYDDDTLRRAWRYGIDAAGQPLNPAMPRFELTPEQEAELLAYLRTLGSDRDLAPGVSDDTVQVALIGDRSPAAQAVQQAALTCLRETNARGGVFGRRFEWSVFDPVELADAAARARLAARAAMVVAPWWPDAAAFAAFAQTLQSERLAIVGPVPPAYGDAPTVFHVVPDPGDALRVIVDHAARRLAPRRATVAVIAPASPADRDAELSQLRDQAALHGHLQLVVIASDSPGAISQALAQHRPAAVIDLGDAAHVARTDAAIAAAGLPDATPILALYARLGRTAFTLPARVRARLAMAHAHPIGDEAAPERMLQRFRQQGVALSQPALQAAAYAAGCVSVEALMRTGRRVTRERLQKSIESIARFETGVTAPLTFGPRQRHGVWGARIVTIDGETLTAQTPWLTPQSP